MTDTAWKNLGPWFTTDRLGRPTSFLISTAGMFASYIAWTGLSGSFISTRDEGTGRAVVAFIFIFSFFYDIAWTPLLQAYPVEIFPYTLRGRGVSVALFSSTVAVILGNQVNPIAMKVIQWKYYIVFCCLLVILFVVIYFLFPETRGHTLEEIREIFEGKLETDDKEKGISNDEVEHTEEDKSKVKVSVAL